MICGKEKSAAIGKERFSSSSGEDRRTSSWNRITLRHLVWIAILMILAISFLGGCDSCWANDLTASFYSHESLHAEGTARYNPNHTMANGEIFADEKMVAACNSFPLNSKVRVTNTASGKSVVVKVTDRTNKRFTGLRCDLSKGAFRKIADLDRGIIPCKVERVK